MSWNTEQIMERIREAAAAGLVDAAAYLLEKSDANVPVESTALQDSGRVSVDADALQAAVSYDTDWAVIQHEKLNYEHDSGRSAKYLEKPFLGEKDELLKLIAKPIRQALG